MSATAPTTLTTDLFVSVDGHAKGDGAPPYFGLYGPELADWIDTEMAAPQQLLLDERLIVTEHQPDPRTD